MARELSQEVLSSQLRASIPKLTAGLHKGAWLVVGGATFWCDVLLTLVFVQDNSVDLESWVAVSNIAVRRTTQLQRDIERYERTLLCARTKSACVGRE